MSALDDYRERMKQLAQHHGFEAGLLLGKPRLNDGDLRRLLNHRAHELASLYGCSAHLAAPLLDAMGGTRPGAVEPWDRSVKQITIPTYSGRAEHRLSERWPLGLAAVLEQPLSTDALNRELRGVSRALWLAALWHRLDVSAIRPSWYHWTGTAPYWEAAWICLRSADGWDRLLAYGRGLLWRYSAARLAEKKAPGTHKAAAYIEAAQRLYTHNAALNAA